MSRKLGVTPARLEDLENTNNIRFLRRRYKDPVTGKDFKLLHVGEVQLTSSPGIAGASPIGGPAAQAGGAAFWERPAPCSAGAAHSGRARCGPADGFWSERGRRLGRGRDLS